MPRGIFRLKQVYEEQLSGEWSTKENVWLSPSPFLLSSSAPFGYVAGGKPEPGTSTVDRIDYSNDTATAVARGPLSSARYAVLATGNADFGYFGGGRTPSPASTVDRIDYSNDTATASPKGPLSLSRYGLAATGNASFGYFGGAGAPDKSTVDRIDYSNDTAAASPKGPLTQERYDPAGVSARENGFVPIGPALVEKVAIQNFPVTSFGYVSLGTVVGAPSPSTSTTERMNFANDTLATVFRGNMPSTNSSTTGVASPSTGYVCGGSNPNNKVIGLDFSNDTVDGVIKATLNKAREFEAATTGNKDFGYIGGGYDGSAVVSAIERIDYSDDTATPVTKGDLDAGYYYLSAVGNQNFGYYIGDFPGGNYSRVQRIDYSNDTANAVVKGTLSRSAYQAGATGNADFGYVIGGQPSEVSKVDRIDYANDTNTAAPKGNMSVPKVDLQATGNINFGYAMGGGYPAPSKAKVIDRIDYSNDTVTALHRSNLIYGRSRHSSYSAAESANPQ